MKNKYLLLAILTGSISLTGCEDFLDQKTRTT